MMQMQEVPHDDTIVRQPRSNAGGNSRNPEIWMSIPLGINHCPPGLEYLTVLDQLFVLQQIEKWELFTGFETKNRFKVKNSLAQNVYYAFEESSCCARKFLWSYRPFELKVLDNFQNEVLHLKRPFRSGPICCLPICLHVIEVFAPPGQVLGTVEQVCTFWKPKFNIKNAYGDVVLHIEGPACFSKCSFNANFNVLSIDNEQIGRITKKFSGLARELVTDADFFSVTFPLHLDVHMKALMFAAVFLIDVLYYER